MILNYLKKVIAKFQGGQTKNLTSILSDGRAIFSYFGEDVYLSDFVNNCIDRIATEISKIQIVSVLQQSEKVRRLNDDITRLFRFKPNPLQTTKDFLAACEWLRRKDCNAFVYPQYKVVQDAMGNKYRKYVAFYPLNPSQIEIGLDDSGDVWEIKFWWRDGTFDILPYSDLIHLRWRRGKNLIIGGGSDYGSADTADQLKAVTTLNKVMEGLPLSIESSLKIKGLYTAKSLLDSVKLDAIRSDFESHILTSSTGIVATDLAGEFKAVDMKAVEIKSEVMAFLKGVIQERYGISTALLSGDYTGEQHNAFYQSCVEDFICEFEQAASSCLFTEREQDVGHRIRCYYSRIAYLSTQNKIDLATLATNTGLMSLNQIASELFGFEPFAGGDRRLQSLNFVNVEIIDKYQVDGKGGSANAKTED